MLSYHKLLVGNPFRKCLLHIKSVYIWISGVVIVLSWVERIQVAIFWVQSGDNNICHSPHVPMMRNVEPAAAGRKFVS